MWGDEFRKAIKEVGWVIDLIWAGNGETELIDKFSKVGVEIKKEQVYWVKTDRPIQTIA